ncbi:hypothetical protein SQ03_02845 [Methylobacterium platani JCM 14648]|uniref:Uncharacterized protein n=2 Tax=Methylobacterium platani TaxID=427683 RepID=A0A179S4M1_9HYPH|nr:hypothetical protein SQ03_02845 [Methylobacterium platani JCM 14648]OAS19108.1 hypothetical protein A5481_25275 [Methylobacterium platani]
MAMNVEARAAVARRRASEDVCLGADISEVAQIASQIQIRRLLARFDFSPERALAVAELAFAATGRRA